MRMTKRISFLRLSKHKGYNDRLRGCWQAAVVLRIWCLFDWPTLSLQNVTRICWFYRNAESGTNQMNNAIVRCRVSLARQGSPEETYEPNNRKSADLEWLCCLALHHGKARGATWNRWTCSGPAIEHWKSSKLKQQGKCMIFKRKLTRLSFKRATLHRRQIFVPPVTQASRFTTNLITLTGKCSQPW